MSYLKASLPHSAPSLFTPVFLRLALHRRRIRVFHFEPVGRAARTVGRALPLRHGTFEPHLAGMGEDSRAIPLDMLVNRMPGRALATMDASVALRTWRGSRRRSSPFNSMRSKAYRNTSPSCWR